MRISVYINGSVREIEEGQSLRGLIDELCLRHGLVIEYNGSIVPMNEWDNLILNDGDKLELVSIVGGG
jgi:sulfur carrier protein